MASEGLQRNPLGYDSGIATPLGFWLYLSVAVLGIGGAIALAVTGAWAGAIIFAWVIVLRFGLLARRDFRRLRSADLNESGPESSQ